MKIRHSFLKAISTLLIVPIIIISAKTSAADTEIQRWQAPFDSTYHGINDNDSLSFARVLGLMAKENPIFKALRWQLTAADEKVRQAGLWANPELGLEFEDFGWDAPGFRETEITVLLSQELELFGQRKARKGLAETSFNSARWENQRAIFNLYLDAKNRYHKLAHDQRRLVLAKEALQLSRLNEQDIADRIKKGVGLQSELLLSRLEYQKTQLNFHEASRELKNASLELSSLWGQKDSNVVLLSNSNSSHKCLKSILDVEFSADSTGGITELIFQKSMLESEQRLVKAEARPALTLSGGFKRLQSDNSSSFVLGVSLPLPFLNRNQGASASLRAESNALDYSITQWKREISADIISLVGAIVQLDEKLEVIDTLLLPTAEMTYQALQQAYDSGRIPFTSLLEGKRALIDLRFEKNDVLLLIKEEQIELERMLGITLESIKK